MPQPSQHMCCYAPSNLNRCGPHHRDEDSSGFLDRQEVEKAVGILGNVLGSVLSKSEAEKAFRSMDRRGEGQVLLAASAAHAAAPSQSPHAAMTAKYDTLGTSDSTLSCPLMCYGMRCCELQVTLRDFEVWWKEQEAEQLIGDMEQGEVAEALAEAGIQVQYRCALLRDGH